MKVIPPAASNAATRNDLYFHNTANAAVASTIALIPSIAAKPADPSSTRPPIALAKNNAREAVANPTPIVSFEFVITQS
jgi:hypothetical protein